MKQQRPRKSFPWASFLASTPCCADPADTLTGISRTELNGTKKFLHKLWCLVHTSPRLPEDLCRWRPCGVQGVLPTNPPSSHPHTHPSSPSPRDFTCLLRSSIILVIWIFFLPIVPNSFFSPPFQEFFFSLLFSSLSCSSLFCLFLCYLFQSAQRFQHPYLQERRGEGEEGGVSIKWNEIWQNTEGKKIIKVASWQPQGRVKKDKESVNNVVRTAVFHCRYHANQFLRFCFFLLFFFPGTDYERRQRCQDRASFTESLTVFWKCR